MAHVGGEEDPRYVFCVGLEFADRDELGDITVLNHAPDIAVTLVEGVSAYGYVENKDKRAQRVPRYFLQQAYSHPSPQ